MSEQNDCSTDRFLTKREVMARTCLRQEAIRVRELHLHTFPRRIYLSSHRVVWLESEIARWIAEQAARRADKSNQD